MNDQQLEAATSKASDGLARYPKSGPLYLNRGSIAVHTNQYEKARPDLEKALLYSDEKLHWTIHTQLARCEIGLGHRAKAEKEFELAARDMAKDPEPAAVFQEQMWRLRGENLAADLRHKEAVESYTKALKAQPDSVKALAGRAMSYAELKNDKSFQADVKVIQKHSPELATALVEESKRASAAPSGADDLTAQGVLQLRRGEHKAAIDLFDQAIKKNPENAQAYQKKGSALQSLRQFPEAIEAYSQSYRLQSDEVSLFNRAICYLNTGDLDQGKADLEKFIKVSTDTETTEKAKSILETLQ